MRHDTDAPQEGVAARRRALGLAIRDARYPTSQQSLGAAVGRPQSCVSVWETGGIELGVDRIFELEEHLGLEHGHLLRAGGYIPAERGRAWWMTGGTDSREFTHAGDTDGGMMSDFPEQLRDWLDQHGSLVEAAAVLRERGREPVALTLLLDTKELVQLRFAWEIWVGLTDGRRESPEVLLQRSLGRAAVERCHMALWGATASNGPSLRLVGE